MQELCWITYKFDEFESGPAWFLETSGHDIFNRKNIGANKMEKNISWHPSNSSGSHGINAFASSPFHVISPSFDESIDDAALSEFFLE